MTTATAPPKKKFTFPAGVTTTADRQAFCRAVAEKRRLAYNVVARSRREGEITVSQMIAAQDTMKDDFLALAIAELPIRADGVQPKPTQGELDAVKLEEVFTKNG